MDIVKIYGLILMAVLYCVFTFHWLYMCVWVGFWPLAVLFSRYSTSGELLVSFC